LLTDRQTNKQTNKVWQKHYLLGAGNYWEKIAAVVVPHVSKKLNKE